MTTDIETIAAAHCAADLAHTQAYKALTQMAQAYENLARVLESSDPASRPANACASLADYAREAQRHIGPI